MCFMAQHKAGHHLGHPSLLLIPQVTPKLLTTSHARAPPPQATPELLPSTPSHARPPNSRPRSPCEPPSLQALHRPLACHPKPGNNHLFTTAHHHHHPPPTNPDDNPCCCRSVRICCCTVWTRRCSCCCYSCNCCCCQSSCCYIWYVPRLPPINEEVEREEKEWEVENEVEWREDRVV